MLSRPKFKQAVKAQINNKGLEPVSKPVKQSLFGSKNVGERVQKSVQNHVKAPKSVQNSPKKLKNHKDLNGRSGRE